MSEEHVKFEGRLALNRKLRMDTQLRMQGLVKSLRNLLDPTKPVEHLEAELIAAQAMDLATLHVAYREQLQEAGLIRQALGK